MSRRWKTYLGHTAFESSVLEVMQLVEDEQALEGLLAHDKLFVERGRRPRTLVRHHQSLQRLRVVDVPVQLRGKEGGREEGREIDR